MLTKAFDIWYTVLKDCLTFVFECSLRHADWWVSARRSSTDKSGRALPRWRVECSPRYLVTELPAWFCTCPPCGGFVACRPSIGTGENCALIWSVNFVHGNMDFAGDAQTHESERIVCTKAHEDMWNSKQTLDDAEWMNKLTHEVVGEKKKKVNEQKCEELMNKNQTLDDVKKWTKRKPRFGSLWTALSACQAKRFTRNRQLYIAHKLRRVTIS